MAALGYLRLKEEPDNLVIIHEIAYINDEGIGMYDIFRYADWHPTRWSELEDKWLFCKDRYESDDWIPVNKSELMS